MIRALQDLKIFSETARQGNLSRVAQLLDLTPAATSAAIKRLEAQLNTVLFVRSTRSLRLTQEGEIFLQHCNEALNILDDGFQAIQRGQSLLKGKLQLSLPSDLGRNRLLPILDEFMERHPQVSIRVQISDRLTDIYRQPVDIAFRYGLPADSALIALPLCRQNDRVLCASPDYIARFGAPGSPEELAQHNCLCFMLADATHSRWHFQSTSGQITVQVKGDRVADDGELVRRWAVAGKGIAYKSRLDISEELKNGQLLQLCPEWRGEEAPLNMLCADRRQLSPLVIALREHLEQALQSQQ
ncbi:LysR family transcriptional regulator [Shewanella chilikensis]|jgi:DNA-binding transcriptional LysR family regulator|uniref:LysR family transcriptional regulator n=1 Tax=Shewanella chilikensis TaxID=558541 RepID=UPI0024B1BE09|nr:LysR family transcriptional regulator [Shewanella chilikensis]